MVRNLILSGGVAHPYDLTSPMLAQILNADGISSFISDSVAELERCPPENYALLTLNCAKWTCSQTPQWRDKWRFELSNSARQGMLQLLRTGTGLLAIHAAVLCFDDWPEYARILGGTWVWGVTSHSPIGQHRMFVHTDSHPVVQGIQDFTITDELYYDLSVTESVRVLVEAEWESRRRPIVWVNEYGEARICYIALGHGVEAFEDVSYRQLLRQAAQWCSRKQNHS